MSLLVAVLLLAALVLFYQLMKVLDNLALQYWHFSPQGAPWDFSGNKELAVITGGSSGFGNLIAKGLASRMKVIVLDLAPPQDDMLHSSMIAFYECDLTSPATIHSVAAKIKKDHGAPTILVNNAGVASSHTILDTSDAWLETIFRVNVMSHFTLIKEFMPGMLAQKKGHVVTMASMAAYSATANLVDYSATKSAALALHNGLSQELRHRYENGHCIRTSIIFPMWARTPLIKTWESSLDTHSAPVLEASDVADAVVKQILAAKSGHVYLPWHVVIGSGMAGWPIWLQDGVRSLQQKLTVKGI